MRIGLIDVDGHNFPNLALMKLSAFHKAQGHTVEFYSPFGGHYDKVYVSKVFSFTPDYPYYINASQIIKGGTGYALHGAGGDTYNSADDKPLPYDVEHIYPDYSLYNITDTAYGFLTRGCPRGCNFCIVGKKEGKCSRKVADLSEFWHGQKNIMLCDPNLLACKEHKELLLQLIDSKAKINVNQGFDIRLMTDENAELIKQMRVDCVHFAWDQYHDKDKILPKLKMFKDITGWNYRKTIVYVLVNFDTTFEQDLERIYTLRDMQYQPYIMIFDKQNATHRYRQLQRWCNNRTIFRSCNTFDEYNRHDTQQNSSQLQIF